MQKVNFSLSNTIRLSWKEFIFYKNSSLLLILVICFVCLPLLILVTLKENYIEYMRKKMMENSMATRIEVVCGDAGVSDFRINQLWVDKVSEREEVKITIPHRTRTVLIQDSDGELVDFEAVSTVRDDPDLKKNGFRGQFLEEKKSVILRKNRSFLFGIDTNQGELLHTIAPREVSRGMRMRGKLWRSKRNGKKQQITANTVTIPEALRQQFEYEGYELSDNLVIERKAKELLINDKDNKVQFSVLKENNATNVYKTFIAGLGISPDTDEISIIVTRSTADRGEEQYIIPCKVSGTLEKGSRSRIYVPLELADDLENWRKGYPVPDLGLPAAKDREMALDDPFYTSAKLFTTTPMDDMGVSALRQYKLKQSSLPGETSETIYGFQLISKDEKPFTDLMWSNVIDSLTGMGNPIIIPQIATGTIFLGENELNLNPTISEDPRKKLLLEHGEWIQNNDKMYDVVLPGTLLEESKPFPYSVNLRISDISIPVNVVGQTDNKQGFALPILLFRINTLLQGKIKFDDKTGTFYPSSSEPSYIMARVHVKSLDDVEPVCNWLEEGDGLTCSSVRGELEQMRSANRMITNLIYLIGGTGLIAVVCSIIGIMYEAINRKRKQIGIMRTLGVSRNNISSIYIVQAVKYGVFGYILVCIIQFALGSYLDTSWCHAMMGIETSERLFVVSLGMRLSFGGVIIVLCVLSGLIPAYIAGRVEPGIVLSE
jgi:putative ABC transport system permease protein